MGREMASNLFTKSLNSQGSEPSPTFIVCDAMPEAAATFARNFQQLHPGVQINVVDTPAEAAELASVIITMLPSSPQVNQVYLTSESGILPGVLKALSSPAGTKPEDLKTLAIDSTTLDVSTAKDVAQRVAKEAQISMVDAPVSGGVVGAAAGTLSFMVGGPASSFDLAKPYLEKMGKTIVHCGDSGTGLAVKICNNLILGINQVAVAEAMLLGTSLGLSPSLLASVINNSTGRCWPSAVNNPIPGALPGQSPPCERDFKGGFAAKLMLKDMNLALNAADSVGVPLPLGNSSVKLYEDVTKDQDLAGRDFSVVFRHLQKLQEGQQ